MGRVSLLVVSCAASSLWACSLETGPSDAAAVHDGEDALTRVTSLQARFALTIPEAMPRADRRERRVRPVIAPSAVTSYTTTPTRLEPVLAGPAAARAARVSLPAHADGATTLEDARTGTRIAFSLRGATSVAAALGGGYAVYAGAYQGSDVVHRADAEGTEDFVAFETRPAHEVLTYDVDVSQVAGLRLVSNTLEMLDASGVPTLRVAAPYVVDANGKVHPASLTVDGCAVDTDAAAPWGRAVTAPGASHCTVNVGWHDVAYPALVDPSWTTTGSMSIVRYGVSATTLASGKVLFAGGNLYATLASEVYDPATGTFSTTGPMTVTRAWHHAALLPSGKVLVSGGAFEQDASGWDYDYTTSTELFDPATGTFTAGPALPESPVIGASLANGDVVFVGAQTSAGAVYHAATNTMAATGSASISHYWGSASLLPSGSVLFAGGADSYWSSVIYATAEIFDPTANGGVGAFTATGSLPMALYGHRATTLPDGRVFVTGGFINDANGNKATELYAPASGTFSSGPLLTWDRSMHSATLLASGHVLVAGCNYNDGKLSWFAHTEEVDPNVGTVVQSDAPSVLNENHVAAKLADGRVVLAPTAGPYTGNTGTGSVVYDATGAAPPPPPACSAPSAPTSLTATSQYRAIGLSWAASTNPSGGFRIYRRTTTGAFSLRATAAKTARSWSDSGLTRGATYVYQLTAWSDCNGNGVFDTGDLEGSASASVTGKAN